MPFLFSEIPPGLPSMEKSLSPPDNFPYVITISSEKGGVGKTTLATNLAIFLKALNEDIPVSIFSFDNHFTIDKMFTIQPDSSHKTVADLVAGEIGAELLQTGQYGVNFIPSSSNLSKQKNAVKGPMDIARNLAISGIGGIIIIDTRPDLDILTENALYAADRVLIPVKDMPSLENCRNIFSLFDKRGLDKKSLVLIPCLIDERIKFDGLFSDQKTLLRAFAINRGYRCHDVYISKSPKVESLNTNPDGKIYPVLTHGKGTDVHGQFTALARDILQGYLNEPEPRSLLFSKWMTSEDQREKDAFIARMGGTRTKCLLCGKEVMNASAGDVGYYFETSDGSDCGFLENDCFMKLLSNSVFNMKIDIASDDPTFMLLKESARKSYFVFKTIEQDGKNLVDFKRMDETGDVQTSRVLSFREHSGGMLHDEKCHLFSLMSETLSGYDNSFRDAFLLVQPVDPAAPQDILQKEQYRRFSNLKTKVASTLT
jgi:chromosome partitioning protein